MALRLITAPTVEPISLAEAKEHCNVDHDSDDALLTTYIKAARAIVDGKDGYLGRALVTQTWELVIDAFPTNEIKIPLPPLQSVASVSYFDPEGFGQLLPSNQYYVDTVSEPGWVVPVSSGWPTGVLDAINAVTIQFTAGYLPPTPHSPPNLTVAIPDDIRAAMLLYIGMLYADREMIVVGTNAIPLPNASEILLRRYRVQLGMA